MSELLPLGSAYSPYGSAPAPRLQDGAADDGSPVLVAEWRGYKGNAPSWRDLILPPRTVGLWVIGSCTKYLSVTVLQGAVQLEAGAASSRWGFRIVQAGNGNNGICIIGAPGYETLAPVSVAGLDADDTATEHSHLVIIPPGAFLPPRLRLGIIDTASNNEFNVGVMALRG